MRYHNDRNNCHEIKTVKVATWGTNEVTDRVGRCHLLVPLVGFFLFQFKNRNDISMSRTTVSYAQKHTSNYNMMMPGRHSDDPNNST